MPPVSSACRIPDPVNGSMKPNASHARSAGTGPVDSPPLALRWSIVMQRKSFLNSSIALNTAVGQLLTRELRPPPGVTNSGKPEPTSS